MIDYFKRWFNRLVHQAIIDGMELHRYRCRGYQDRPDEDAHQQQAIFLLIGLEVWMAIIFVIVAKVVAR